MREGIAGLSPKHQSVVILYYLEGRSLQETADALGLPLGTVKSRIHHALRDLRGRLSADRRFGGAWGEVAHDAAERRAAVMTADPRLPAPPRRPASTSSIGASAARRRPPRSTTWSAASAASASMAEIALTDHGTPPRPVASSRPCPSRPRARPRIRTGSGGADRWSWRLAGSAAC